MKFFFIIEVFISLVIQFVKSPKGVLNGVRFFLSKLFANFLIFLVTLEMGF